MIAHVVLFQPKKDTPPPARQEFLEAIRSVTREVPSIRRARVGHTTSIGLMPEDLIGQKTFNYAAILEFDDQAGLADYLNHPVHDRLRGLFWTLCESTLIADVELSDPLSVEADKLV